MAKVDVIAALERTGPFFATRTAVDGTTGVAQTLIDAGHDDILEFYDAVFYKTNAAAGALTMTIEDDSGNDITDAMDINVADQAIVRPTTVDNAQVQITPAEGAQIAFSGGVANTGVLVTQWLRIQPA